MGIAEEIVGTHFRYPDYFEVGREKVREFANAVQDQHPAHHSEAGAAEHGHDAIIASLTFIAVAGRRVQLEIFNQFDVPVNLERVLHRDQKLVFHRPIKVGDKLWFDSYLDSVIESHGAILTEVRGEVTDDDGRDDPRRGRTRGRGRRGHRTDRRRPRCRDREDGRRAERLNSAPRPTFSRSRGRSEHKSVGLTAASRVTAEQSWPRRQSRMAGPL